MATIKVRPSREDLVVLDDLNRQIPYKKEGVTVRRTAMIGRYLRDGDLLDEKAMAEADAKAKAKPAKGGK
jgi:hypothetical protein